MSTKKRKREDDDEETKKCDVSLAYPPQKRKRGRPRKNPLPSCTNSVTGGSNISKNNHYDGFDALSRSDTDKFLGLINEETVRQKKQHIKKYFKGFDPNSKKGKRKNKKRPKINGYIYTTRDQQMSQCYGSLPKYEKVKLKKLSDSDLHTESNARSDFSSRYIKVGSDGDYPQSVSDKEYTNVRPLISFPVETGILPMTPEEEIQYLEMVLTDKVEEASNSNKNTSEKLGDKIEKKSKKGEYPFKTRKERITQEQKNIFNRFKDKGHLFTKAIIHDKNRFEEFKERNGKDLEGTFKENINKYPIINRIMMDDKIDPDGYYNREKKLNDLKNREFPDIELVSLRYIRDYQVEPNPSEDKYHILCENGETCILKLIGERNIETWSSVINTTSNNQFDAKTNSSQYLNNKRGFIGRAFFLPSEMTKMEKSNTYPPKDTKVPCYYCYIFRVFSTIELNVKNGVHPDKPINKFRVKTGPGEFSVDCCIGPLDINGVKTHIAGYFPQFSSAGISYITEEKSKGKIINRVVDNMDFQKASVMQM